LSSSRKYSYVFPNVCIQLIDKQGKNETILYSTPGPKSFQENLIMLIKQKLRELPKNLQRNLRIEFDTSRRVQSVFIMTRPCGKRQMELKAPNIKVYVNDFPAEVAMSSRMCSKSCS